jgi:tellurite resistance-related uncharacterized protein
LDSFSLEYGWAYLQLRLPEESSEPPKLPKPPELPEPPESPELVKSTDLFGEGGSIISLEKWYKKGGKYRTTVEVVTGKVIVAPYDEKGPKYEEGVILFAGQQLVIETGAPVYKYGFDYQVLKEIRKKYQKIYLAGRYKVTISVIEGEVKTAVYDEKGPDYQKGVTLTAGQQTTQVTTIKAPSTQTGVIKTPLPQGTMR